MKFMNCTVLHPFINADQGMQIPPVRGHKFHKEQSICKERVSILIQLQQFQYHELTWCCTEYEMLD